MDHRQDEVNQVPATSPEVSAQLAQRLAAHDIPLGYHNVHDEWIAAPAATLEKIAEQFDDDRQLGEAEPLIVTPGRWHPELFGTLILESGHHYRAAGVVDLPGYHILYDDYGRRRFVIAAPEHLRVPERGWGWQIQLYAARSRNSWGIGDFRDLALICRIAAAQGASCVQVSPVHAVAPADHIADSPYSPASRMFLNLLHVAPGAITGAERVDLSDLAQAGQRLNAQRMIDRDAVWALKREALRRIWRVVKDEPDVERDRWIAGRGNTLRQFAIWSVLVEEFGADWRDWPESYRRPDSQLVRQFADEHADDVAFHSWAQWVAAVQYAEACRSGVDVIADMAVGADANSQEAWINQELFSMDFEIGAPPDSHNLEGQSWGLPPMNPQRLVRADLRPYINMARWTLQYAGAMRIDHVMQVWRLYWVPKQGGPKQGAYVHYPVHALLAILRLESMRTGAWIVGEDMGTVAPGVRESMASINMLGNRSANRTPVQNWPHLCVGTSSTHDQATLAGLITGHDAADLKRIGKQADFGSLERARRELCEMAQIDPNKPLEEISEAELHRAIIERYRVVRTAPSLIVLVSLDDAAAVRERPNMPGTTDAYPNWKFAMPRPVEDIMTSELSQDLVKMLRQDR